MAELPKDDTFGELGLLFLYHNFQNDFIHSPKTKRVVRRGGKAQRRRRFFLID
jgi:hypothetical protein